MRILALDQASRISGYAIFDDGDLIESGAFASYGEEVGDKLVYIRNKVIELIENNSVDEVVFEDIQLQQNAATYKVLGEVLGVVEELCAERKLPYTIVPSVTWKSALGIKGRTRPDQKRNAQAFVQNTYNKKVTQDESDAICIGTYKARHKVMPSEVKTNKEELTFDW